ncbi:unnamed protein product, partial [Mesorhabditis spiculigera]
MDHAELIAEFPRMEELTPQERIALAKDRRRTQLRKNQEQELILGPPRPRKQRLRFASEFALLDATATGDLQEVERLLNEGANPNSHNEDGLTPLHQCAIDDNQPIMKLLLSRGADVNSQDTEQWTPLHAAACCAHISVVRILIDKGANLLAVNADGNMPYDICDDEQTLDCIESEMARRGITQEFIDKQRGASEQAMLDDMKWLHQQGLPLEARMHDGSTYLHTAAANGFYDVAAFLLRCGVPHGVRDNDLWQPIHAAACWAQPDLVELLCEYGGDISAKTNQQETPLELCEDPTTRAIITSLQQQEARRRRQAFGVRDSRRQSRKRKKYESPQAMAAVGQDNPFSARGAIRRQSLRDRNGITAARIDARHEQDELMRSWSKEDVSTPEVLHQPHPRESPTKRNLKGMNKPKPMSPDEWLRKLEAGQDEEDEREGEPRRVGSQRKRPKKGAPPEEFRGGGGETRREYKAACCCTIM